MVAVGIEATWVLALATRGAFLAVLVVLAVKVVGGKVVCKATVLKASASKSQAGEVTAVAVRVVYLGVEVLDGKVACFQRQQHARWWCAAALRRAASLVPQLREAVWR